MGYFVDPGYWLEGYTLDMTFIVETGVGVRNANAYVDVAFVTDYLTSRNRQTENSWNSSLAVAQEAAVVAATDYIDRRFGARFKGVTKFTFSSVTAKATVTFSGLPVVGETLSIGDETYTFVSALSLTTPFQVLIGADATATGDALEAALNGDSTNSGILFSTGTAQNRHVVASNDGGVVTLIATAQGTSGNLTFISGSPTNVTTTSFAGGRDGGKQRLAWPRATVFTNAGTVIVGIPLEIKQAVAEYAVRAVSSVLLPDPTLDATGRVVTRKKEKVGPIETDTEYSEGTSLTQLLKAYPTADRLLVQLLLPTGGTFRG